MHPLFRLLIVEYILSGVGLHCAILFQCEVMPYGIVKFCADAQSEVKFANKH